MFSSHWLHNLLGVAHSRKDHRCQAAPLQRRVRLMLELLEDRITPSPQWGPPTDAISNAIAVQTASANYVNQLINSLIADAGQQTSILNPGNSGQNALGGALAVLSENFAAIGAQPPSSNYPLSPIGLLRLELQLQQQLQQAVQSPVGQSAFPPFTGIAVNP